MTDHKLCDTLIKKVEVMEPKTILIIIRYSYPFSLVLKRFLFVFGYNSDLRTPETVHVLSRPNVLFLLSSFHKVRTFGSMGVRLKWVGLQVRPQTEDCPHRTTLRPSITTVRRKVTSHDSRGLLTVQESL